MKRAIIRLAVLALSMALVPPAVKAQDQTLPSVKDRPIGQESNPKDSVKDGQSGISKLVQVVMTSGKDGEYINGFAQAVGLDGPMPAKGIMTLVGTGARTEARKCNIIYATDEAGSHRPMCVYLIKEKKTKHDSQARFFRVDLNGQLEKVITLKNNLDTEGKALREGRSRIEEDIDSPDIKKVFTAEMSFWLKDWLKKQQKLNAKKTTASAAKTGAVAAASVAPAQATP